MAKTRQHALLLLGPGHMVGDGVGVGVARAVAPAVSSVGRLSLDHCASAHVVNPATKPGRDGKREGLLDAQLG
jgi:hypothetical protein